MESFSDYVDESNSRKSRKNLRYNILDVKVKRFLVNQIKYMRISQVANMYGVSINNLERWQKAIDRKEGAGRKVTDNEMEKKLIEWIKQMNI